MKLNIKLLSLIFAVTAFNNANADLSEVAAEAVVTNVVEQVVEQAVTASVQEAAVEAVVVAGIEAAAAGVVVDQVVEKAALETANVAVGNSSLKEKAFQKFAQLKDAAVGLKTSAAYTKSANFLSERSSFVKNLACSVKSGDAFSKNWVCENKTDLIIWTAAITTIVLAATYLVKKSKKNKNK
jgi:hypothetical protein